MDIISCLVSSQVSVMDEFTVETLLQNVAREQNFKNPKVVLSESPFHGYLATVNKATIRELDKNGDGRRIHLFIKRKPQVSENFNFIYKNEADFYKFVPDAFQSILPEKHNSDELLPSIPKCYYASEDLLVLADLTEAGFKLWTPLNKALDVSHVDAILKEYGKFHAFSFALKEKNREQFESIGIRFDWFYENYERLTNNGYLKSFTEKIAAAFDENTESHFIDAVANYMCNDYFHLIERLLVQTENEVNTHGDSWTHNFMFRYEENDKIEEVCLLDFQLFRKGSPVLDLSYFLCTSGCSQEIFDSIDDRLKVYHNSLLTNSEKLNCSANIYTWETLKYEWCQFSLKGLSFGAFVLKMMIADKDELERHKHIEMPMQFDFVSKNEALYHEKVRILVKYFYHAGILKN